VETVHRYTAVVASQGLRREAKQVLERGSAATAEKGSHQPRKEMIFSPLLSRHPRGLCAHG